MTTIDISATAETWTSRAQDALTRYAEPLLRRVMQQLLKPRNQWPVEELIERGVATLTNAAVIDRRLSELPPASRKLLAVIGISRKPTWKVGQLIAILATLGHAEGLTPIQRLLDEGLIHPELPSGLATIKQFEDWLGPTGITTAKLFAHPAVTVRALANDLDLPALPTRTIAAKAVRVSDGLEWLLRSAVAWSRVAGDPLRLTQQQSLFKRDLQKFQTDDLLSAPFTEHYTDLTDPGLFALDLASATGLVEIIDGQLHAISNPELWKKRLLDVLVSCWPSLFEIESWDPLKGYHPAEEGSTFPSMVMSVFLLLRSLPDDQWVQAQPLVKYLTANHPSWFSSLRKDAEQAHIWLERVLLGIAYPLRLIEVAQEGDDWWFRLADVGQHLLHGDKLPSLDHEFPQSLIVQPNGEMIVFRQGLTPELIGNLTRLAYWKNLGAACTMELTAESVYRGLETGLTLTDMQRVLEQHGTRSLPANVLDSLKRWASKRERITVWSAATLLEFSSEEDLENAFARGLVSTKLTDRIGIAVGSEEIDYKHFRLVGNRDYESRPQKCLTFDGDGVTFTIDMAQSDLILEAELGQIAIPLPSIPSGPRRYQFTPDSLRQAIQRSFTLSQLEQWALDRSGESLSYSARLLAAGSQSPATVRKRLVVELPNELVADGIMQWPATVELIEDRLGPTAVAVTESNLAELTERLRSIGVALQALEEGD